MTLARSGCRPDEGAYKASDKYTLEDAHIPGESEDGDNSLSQGNRNEPEPDTQLGESGKNTVDSVNEDDQPLNIEKILLRFDEIGKNRYRGDTPMAYKRWFKRFADHADLQKYTRRQIAGPLGKRLILDFLSTVRKRSQKVANYGIKSVWRRGLNLPYPVEADIDLDRPPKPMPRSVPPDSIIREWAQKLNNENDAYYRAFWLVETNYGWRPQAICKMKWRNVEWDENGRPVRFIGDGAKEIYKNNSAIVAVIFPEIAGALMDLRKMPGYDPSPEKPIFPYRYLAKGSFTTSDAITTKKTSARKHPYKVRNTPTEQRTCNLRIHWDYLRKKHGLPKLRMCDVRHWVSKTCKRAGLTEQDRDVVCALMGHDPDPGSNMQNWYSAKTVEEIIDLQLMRLPNGPLGMLFADVQMSSDIPPELATLWLSYSNGQICTFDLVREIETLKNRQILKPTKMET